MHGLYVTFNMLERKNNAFGIIIWMWIVEWKLLEWLDLTCLLQVDLSKFLGSAAPSLNKHKREKKVKGKAGRLGFASKNEIM